MPRVKSQRKRKTEQARAAAAKKWGKQEKSNEKEKVITARRNIGSL
jgi:hypothetical protein